jgi:hypothetical protein
LTRIEHPNGQQTTFEYQYDFLSDNYFRLWKVTGSTGNQLIFTYDDPSNPTLLRSVFATNRGQAYSVDFGYSDLGQLESIKDAIGLVTTFTYRDDSDFIDSMTTPYGTTTFDSGDLPDGGHFVEVTDPAGGTERVEVHRDAVATVPDTETQVPAGMAVRNESLNKRNSYHWQKKAMQEIKARRAASTLPPDGVDYSLAHVTHWLGGQPWYRHADENPAQYQSPTRRTGLVRVSWTIA